MKALKLYDPPLLKLRTTSALLGSANFSSLKMLLLLQTFNKLCSKLQNRHGRHGCKASSSVSRLQAMEDDVSSCLNQLLLSSSDNLLSFSWLLQLLQALPILHQAFAKLVFNLDHPVGKWGAHLVDGYLNYNLNLLDLLNSISFSLSQLGKSRVSVSYALSRIQRSPSVSVLRLEPIFPMRGFERLVIGGTVEVQKKDCSGKEWAVKEALATMEGTGYWICGVVLSGCEGDSTAYLEMRKLAAGVAIPAFKAVDSVISAVVSRKGSVPEEVREGNSAAAEIIDSGEAAEEMRKKLGRLEKAVERLRKEVDERFSEVVDGRSRLLDVFRHS